MFQHPLGDAVDLPGFEMDRVLTLDQSGEHLPLYQALDGHLNGFREFKIPALKINKHRAHELTWLEAQRIPFPASCGFLWKTHELSCWHSTGRLLVVGKGGAGSAGGKKAGKDTYLRRKV